MKKFLNFINNPITKTVFLLIFLLFLYVFICAYSYAQSVSYDLSESVFRLHVLANSDSKEDQQLTYMNQLCTNCSNKEEAIKIVTDNKENFKEIALNTIKNQGYSYDVNINIGNFEFPTKVYGDISLPAGYYDALRVEIGEAKGQNWWCVMFPPLCFVDVSSGIVPDESKELLENSLNEEEFALVSDKSNSKINFKFKLLEFFTESGLLTAKNN